MSDPKGYCLAFAGALLFACAPVAAGASTDPVFVSLRLHSDNGQIQEYQTYPEENVRILFPSADAWLKQERDMRALNLPVSPVTVKSRLFQIEDMDHRFVTTAVAFGNELFLFEGLFCHKNSAAMTELIGAADGAPKTGNDALDLAEFYLSVSDFALDAPERFVFRNHKSKQKADSPNAGFLGNGRFLSSPKISRIGTTYSVDLYTYAEMLPGGGPIAHRRFQISGSQLVERFVPETEEFGRTQTDADDNQLKLAVRIMGDGQTDDGATTDLQVWSASDGFAISRIHYYYTSADGVERRVKNLLESAVAVLVDEPLPNRNETNPDKEMLVVRADKNARSLVASLLYIDEKSVLEYSCPCLNTLQQARLQAMAMSQPASHQRP